MATIYVRAANPIWYFVDLVGFSLNDQYYAFFLQNTFPYLPQPVFSDVNGMFPWPDPLQFFPNGTLPDNLYFNPDLVYRIEIRQGNTQSDPLIYEIDNFVPGNSSGGTVVVSSPSDNQISNSQFSQINFTSPYTISTAGTYNVAPGWNLILNGTGSVSAVVTQIVLTGADQQINDPPFALRINTNNWSSAILQQTFQNNGAIWTSTPDEQEGIIFTSLTARSEGSPYPLTVNYVPSNGTPQTILTGSVTNVNYQVLQSSNVLAASDNADLSTSAFVNIDIVLQGTGIVDITNVQVAGESLPVGSTLPDPIPYVQETIERQVDHLFHYYADQLITRPKKNLLVGWTFSLNPWQFTKSATTLQTSLCAYSADQTIVRQETASSLNVGKAGAGGNNGFQLQAVNGVNANRFAIIQYIDQSTIRQAWGSYLSCLVRARIFTTSGSIVPLKARLIYRSDLPPTIGNSEPITGWDANGDVLFSAGWTALKPLNDPAYTLLNSNALEDGVNEFQKMAFDQFSLPVAPDSDAFTATAGLVLYTTVASANPVSSADIIVFDKISLVPNLFAVEASPQTYDEVLRECQFYYEKSYQNNSMANDLPGTATFVSVVSAPQTLPNPSAASHGYAKDFY